LWPDYKFTLKGLSMNKPIGYRKPSYANFEFATDCLLRWDKPEDEKNGGHNSYVNGRR
jgi:hypothetical protein